MISLTHKRSYIMFYFLSSIIFLSNFLNVSLASIFDYSHIEGSGINVIAGKLSSKRYIIPFAYIDLEICNSEKISDEEDTLGEILTGEHIYITGYSVNTNINKYCEVLCLNKFSETSIKRYRELIKRNYFTNWYVDKLPAGKIIYDSNEKHAIIDYFNGIPLGYTKKVLIGNNNEEEKFYIYNHYQFHILLNQISDKKFDIVGFNILPMSIMHQKDNPACVKQSQMLLDNFNLAPQEINEENPEIMFTYDVIFEYSNDTLASRWDHYKPSTKSIHWIGIIFSNLIILIFAFIIYFALSRSLRKEIDAYNEHITNSDIIDYDDYGWKQVAGDVFRAPMINKMLLCSLVGIGVHLFFMLNITLFFGVFGYLNPEKRAKLLNIAIILYCFMGLPSGYVSTYLYRYFGGKNWLKNTLLTSIFFPFLLFFGYFSVDIILHLEKSNAAVGFFDIFVFFFFWIICSFPLILIGSFFAIKGKKMEVPCRIHPIPSAIPEKPCYYKFRFFSGITGLICFATIFIELSYVMASLWKHQIYFIAIFLLISFFIYVIVSGELSIIVVYLNLCKGDYKWWWKSFIIGASPVIYFMLYSVYYFFSLKITRISAMAVYFGIMGLISLMMSLIGGSLSLLITLGFLIAIYSKIKAD